MRFLPLTLLFSSSLLTAAVWTETFSDLTHFDSSSSTAIWNSALGRLHVPFYVDRNSVDNIHSEDDAVNLGTGGDGAFLSSTYPSTTITLDTSKSWEFTTFNLEVGYTLTGDGDDPLVIRVLGNVTIGGTIDLRSGAGGGAGGGGGAINFSGAAGSNATNGSTGGGAGGATSSNGGGGGHGSAGTVGGGGGGGAGGAQYGDDYLTTIYGGAGGGGGGGSGTTQGGAGGRGGGALRIDCGGSFTLESTGSILATGSNGVAGAGGAGSGGGGAGGSVVLYSGSTMTLNGNINGDGGSGGAAPNGTGSAGRMRMASFTVSGPSFNGPISPGPALADFGFTSYSTAQDYIIVSKGYDSGKESPVYVSFAPTETKNSGDTITYEMQSSSDNFVSDRSEYVTTDNISQLNGKRYFRYRITLRSASGSTSPSVSKLELTTRETSFGYRSSGCAAVHAPFSLFKAGSSLAFWLLLLSFPIALRRFISL